MTHNSDDLKSRLRTLRQKNVYCRYFIPELRLYEVVTEESVRKAFHAASVKPYIVDEVVKHVLRDGRKIFSILILIDQVEAALKFIEEGEFKDDRLPFHHNTFQKLIPPLAYQDFEEKQWEVIAPSFYRGTIHRSLQNDFILPFHKDDYINKGSFGTVFEIELNKQHQQLEEAFQHRLVRKELVDIQDHKTELENLVILSHLQHPNIVELLASYRYSDKNNLIFPLAEGGSLNDLFATDQRTTCLKTNDRFFVALAGLASAIDHVHDFVEDRINLKLIGCHFDLRPKNIFVSRDTLLLADFGLSRFKEISESSATLFKDGGGDYRAPECEDIDDDLFPKHSVRRSSDIWSFGCVLSEAITYMIRGPAGVVEFEKVRSFQEGKGRYQLFHCGRDKPNEAVGEWLSQLRASASSRACSKIIDLIEEMLSLEEKKRPKAKDVTAALQLIALYEVTDMVNKRLSELLRNDSNDAFIEHTRFQAWQVAIGTLHTPDMADSTEETIRWPYTRFGSMLDILYKIQDLFDPDTPRPQSAGVVPVIRFMQLNNHLDEFLDERLQERSRTYFRSLILQHEKRSIPQQVQDNMSEPSLPADIRVRITLKHMTKLATQDHKLDTRLRQLDVHNVKIESEFGDHHIGTFDDNDISSPVVVEWRQYGRQSSDAATNEELFNRVKNLVTLLGTEQPNEFRTLHCQGFVHGHQRNPLAFGLVFSSPQTAVPTETAIYPRSLQNLLNETFGNAKHHPALDDRFRIAFAITTSVFEFHQVGWLHKRLFSSNIAFFGSIKTLNRDWYEDEWFRRPYVIGFSHSRPGDTVAFTAGPEESAFNHYQHPEYLNDARRYCKEFDYYSLGILLLEIGLWRPLHDMIRKYQGFSYEEFRQHLVQEKVPLLKQCMGRDYCEAVRTCLQGNFNVQGLDDNQAFEADPLPLIFNARVVRRLEKLFREF